MLPQHGGGPGPPQDLQVVQPAAAAQDLCPGCTARRAPAPHRPPPPALLSRATATAAAQRNTTGNSTISLFWRYRLLDQKIIQN